MTRRFADLRTLKTQKRPVGALLALPIMPQEVNALAHAILEHAPSLGLDIPPEYAQELALRIFGGEGAMRAAVGPGTSQQRSSITVRPGSGAGQPGRRVTIADPESGQQVQLIDGQPAGSTALPGVAPPLPRRPPRNPRQVRAGAQQATAAQQLPPLELLGEHEPLPGEAEAEAEDDGLPPPIQRPRSTRSVKVTLPDGTERVVVKDDQRMPGAAEAAAAPSDGLDDEERAALEEFRRLRREQEQSEEDGGSGDGAPAA